ncbi:HD domain-containing protein [Lujinxingia sediminis]|uniref:HD domain-containing protein n=1 Tax=Lujinxingia sediminis TaxID=2480984 RepID=A0ABY0CSZ7_9DELT|nr:HD domain-containing protein [Lujinxingia sediminis]RVU43536.1 HD domain-containing protein [Lujinxingia sediminis]
MTQADNTPERGYSERFDDAFRCASSWHRAQTRKGKQTPYINHLMAVAALVGSNGGSEDQVIAALLHDAIEDCVGEIPDIAAQIGERFGADVLFIVEGCTDAYEDPKPPWQPRKEAYLAHLRELPDDSPILLVSLADKVHNASSIVRDLQQLGDALWERFSASKAQSLWYYRSLAEIFEAKMPGYLSGELKRLVGEMGRG